MKEWASANPILADAFRRSALSAITGDDKPFKPEWPEGDPRAMKKQKPAANPIIITKSNYMGGIVPQEMRNQTRKAGGSTEGCGTAAKTERATEASMKKPD